ncbi:MAG TPA: hypothetical protein VLW53_12860 [Candidatus Eisenbacteria bacterium]|nr:hypothetical protein [Candidatus Eisenbacteria bacterium]
MRKFFISTVSVVLTVSSLIASGWSAAAAWSPGPGIQRPFECLRGVHSSGSG